MYKAVVFLLTATIVMGGPYGGDLDAIFEDIFGANSTNLITNSTKTTRDTSTVAVGDINSSTPVTEEVKKCFAADGMEGRCVVYYACDKQDKSQDTDGLIDIHIETETCDHYLLVCCPLK